MGRSDSRTLRAGIIAAWTQRIFARGRAVALVLIIQIVAIDEPIPACGIETDVGRRPQRRDPPPCARRRADRVSQRPCRAVKLAWGALAGESLPRNTGFL
jgi:hypothetical protein